jgi:outer membrane protein TolC
MMTGRSAVILIMASLLAGCASRPAGTLASAPDTHREAAALNVDMAALRLDPLKPIVIDPADGLSPDEVAVLAVLNNADLAAKRAARGVAAAQVFAAGLLPDPQIAASFDHPIAGPDNLNAYSVAPSLDLAALLTRTASRHAAQLTSRQGDLDLLWAEWGTAQQARQQAETVLAAQTRQASLRPVLAVAAGRAERSAQALARGDVTSQTAAADLAAKLEAQTALTAAETDEAKARAELASLLNLDAGVRLPLAPESSRATYGADAVRGALMELPSRRPDLLALQAGYQAQDLNVRVAALNRFPLTQIGFAFARDTAGSVTEGLTAAFALPLFNGGRGALAIQTATREQLRAEYQARLDQTEAEVQAAQGDLARSQARAAVLAVDQPALDAALAPAEAAYGRGDLDSQAYLSLVQTALSKRADLHDAQLQARLAEIQLETLLFLPPLPPRSQP